MCYTTVTYFLFNVNKTVIYLIIVFLLSLHLFLYPFKLALQFNVKISFLSLNGFTFDCITWEILKQSPVCCSASRICVEINYYCLFCPNTWLCLFIYIVLLRYFFSFTPLCRIFSNNKEKCPLITSADLFFWARFQNIDIPLLALFSLYLLPQQVLNICCDCCFKFPVNPQKSFYSLP